MADLIRESINDGGPRPITPYYNDVAASVQRPGTRRRSVNAPRRRSETDDFMADVLQRAGGCCDDTEHPQQQNVTVTAASATGAAASIGPSATAARAAARPEPVGCRPSS